MKSLIYRTAGVIFALIALISGWDNGTIISFLILIAAEISELGEEVKRYADKKEKDK